MPYDVYTKADGRNREYRRGGFLFFTDEPVRLEDDQVTEELRTDPWLFLVPVVEADEANDRKSEKPKRGGGK